MHSLFAPFSATVAELKSNATALLDQSEGEAIAILDQNLPAAYLVSAEVYERLLEKLEDYELADIVKARQSEKPLAVEVTLDDL